MRILHLTVVKNLAPSIRKQLVYENRASESLSNFEWSCIALHGGEPKLSFEIQIPIYFRALFLRDLYAWIYMLRVQSLYDVILLRYMPFDPFVIVFGWFVRHRVTIHHAKEIEELRLVRSDWTGAAASILERLTGWVGSKQIIGVLGVTSEIARYEVDTYNLKCPLNIYPNGISVAEIDILEDRRESGLNIAFVCSSFSPWHGLERLVKLLSLSKTAIVEHNIRIHLIGALTLAQNELIEELNKSQLSIFTYGLMQYEQYVDILSLCDVGVASLAMDIQKLTEGSTLKVREYLALGLPVYSNHKDAAIPDEYPYYRQGTLEISEIVEFSLNMKKISRSNVRASSAKYIEKEIMMVNLDQWLKDLPQ